MFAIKYLTPFVSLEQKSVRKFYMCATRRSQNIFLTCVSACVSAVIIELNFASDAVHTRFPGVAAALTPNSLLESSVSMCFYPLNLFSTTSLNLF